VEKCTAAAAASDTHIYTLLIEYVKNAASPGIKPESAGYGRMHSITLWLQVILSIVIVYKIGPRFHQVYS
jgi:hypothetical protein